MYQGSPDYSHDTYFKVRTVSEMKMEARLKDAIEVIMKLQRITSQGHSVPQTIY